MAESYYKTIKGEKYDRSLLEMAEGFTKKKGSSISAKEAKALFSNASDGKGVTDTELKTLVYISENFSLSKDGKNFFESRLKELKKPEVKTTDEAKKGKFWLWLILLLLLILLILLFFFMRSCSGSSQTREIPQQEMEALADQAHAMDSESQGVQQQEAPQKDLSSIVQQLNASAFPFDKGTNSLLPQTESSLKGVAALLKENANLKIKVVGHACKLGSQATNEKVSRNRAQSVADFLVRQGVESSRLQVVARGSSQPISNGDRESDLSQNRRVSLEVIP